MGFNLTKFIQPWRILLIAATAVAGLAIATNSLGLFQLLEWGMLDQFFRLRPREPIDPRIVIVTIDEPDISYVKQWPFSDATLAQLIGNLKKKHPSAIGLDLYRNFPLEPGHQALVKVFRSTPNLIGVEKVAGQPVAPPPALSQKNQVALADLVLDADGKIRRALLSIRGSKGTQLSLGTQMALMYLEKKGITLQMRDAQKKHLQLGKAVFIPLTGNEGGYVGADTGGYQILLNYRGGLKSFRQISLRDVLENRIPDGLLRDRIVMIGATAASLNDLKLTPYSKNSLASAEQTPGVVIHANVASQILSAALEGRPLLRGWVKPLQWLWILGWSLIGASSSWFFFQSKQLSRRGAVKWTIFASGNILIEVSLLGGSYLAFLAGWWLPVCPPMLAFLGSTLAIAGCHNLQLQRKNADLEILLQNATEHYDDLTATLELKAEEAVRESERKLAQFLEAMPVGVAVLDHNGKVYYVNQTARQLLGKGVLPDVTTEQLPEVYQLYLAGTNKIYPSEKMTVVRALKGESCTADDMEIHRGDTIIPLESLATPIYDQSGNLTYAILVFRDITERKKAEAERQALNQKLIQLNVAYSRFVPRQFLQLLNKESIIDVELGDQIQKQMSVLFSDIRNFTTLSESITPEENFRFINGYLSRMEPAIIDNNGFVDKYIGDAIMALFSGEADNAVRAAISMLRRLADYNQSRGRPKRPKIQIGIGINTGSMMLGTVGGASRMDGTVISDAVNIASRIEGLTKNYGVSLLISHNTFLALNNPWDYDIRLIEKVKVKGKSEKVTVYEVFDADPLIARQSKLKTKTVFERAVLLFHLGRFQEAARLFEECLATYAEDKVSIIYLQRCRQEEVDTSFVTN